MSNRRLQIVSVAGAVIGTLLVLYASIELPKPLAFGFGFVYGALVMKATEPWRIKRNDDRLVEEVRQLVTADLKKLRDDAPMN